MKVTIQQAERQVETFSPPVEAAQIVDAFGRRFPYLRLSITDVCNFRCTYCLPDGYTKTHADTFLTAPEIKRLVTAFAELGTWKIRLTGGEPTLRRDFLEIAETVSQVPGISHLALTTNGYKLPQRIKSFYDVGIRAINISIDSLDPRVFKDITGHNRLHEALDGMYGALNLGFSSVKLNTVLLKGVNDTELDRFLHLVKNTPVSLRFIELMETGEHPDYFKKYHVSAAALRHQLEERDWVACKRTLGAGPAVEYEHADFIGRIGIIAPYSKDFCKTCNRLRISARGELHLCLFGDGGYNLRHLLQADDQKDELKEGILNLMHFKQSSHFLEQGHTGARPHLASIGG